MFYVIAGLFVAVVVVLLLAARPARSRTESRVEAAAAAGGARERRIPKPTRVPKVHVGGRRRPSEEEIREAHRITREEYLKQLAQRR